MTRTISKSGLDERLLSSEQRPSGADVMEALLRKARGRNQSVADRPDAPPLVTSAPTGSFSGQGKTTPPLPIESSIPLNNEATPTLAETMRALITTAIGHEKAQRWDEAAASWAAASRVMPHEPKLKLRGSNALARAAQASLRSGHAPRRALEQARAAVTLASDNVHAHTTLAQVFMAGGLKTSARAALERALQLAPQSPAVRELSRKIDES